jgi:tetratricopeptide (TPR) repeat protein
MAHYFLGVVLVAKHNYPQALTRLQKAPELHYNTDIHSWIGMTHALAGRRDQAVKILNELKARSKNELVPSETLLHVYIGLGDFDKAFEYLNKSSEEPNSGSILLLKVAPWLDPLRSDPRFKELLKKVGLDD